MSTTKAAVWANQIRTTSLIDLGIILAIYLLPGLTHVLPVPLYLIDPMRLLLFLTLLTTDRTNSLVLAATIPFLSTFFSGHPVFPKNILISAELSLNVIVFHWIMGKKDSVILAGVASILSAKVFYYLLKYGFITAGFLGGMLITTPLGYQLIPLILLPFILFGLDKLRSS
ncbi:MAG: hypothetical protein K9N35_08055 [Candidatus Marinimicrobia bacterium]|nr:hypothetical protein [Candidatus Neomarinimicrobiota bacterium]